MRILFKVSIVLAVACVGCYDANQKGSFGVSSSESLAIEQHPGFLTILRGYALNANNEPTGPERPLIYWLTICPGLQANGSGTESGDSSHRSVHKQTWFAQPNDVVIEVDWDRLNDNVIMHGKQYVRSDGNVFVIVRESDGKISSWQIKGNEDSSDPKEVMKSIRSKLPDNKWVAGVELVELDNQ